MEVIRKPNDIVFANNQVLFEFEFTYSVPQNIRVQIKNKVFGFRHTPYKYAENKYRVVLDISDILSAYANDVFVATGSISYGELLNYELRINQQKFIGKYLLGGVSKCLQKQLALANTNIFNYRLLNPKRQFLLTTRTNGKIIRMRKKEIGDICFLAPTDKAVSFKINGQTKAIAAKPVGTPICVNLRHFTGDNFTGEIPFFVAGNANPVFKIQVEDTFSENSLVLKFKNSFGVYDRIELTGRATWKPKTTTNSDYYAYNKLISDLEKKRKRETTTEFLEVNSGYKSTEEMFLLRELLMSDSIFLLENNRELECLVTGNLIHAYRQILPESTVLKIEMVNADSNYSALDSI